MVRSGRGKIMDGIGKRRKIDVYLRRAGGDDQPADPVMLIDDLGYRIGQNLPGDLKLDWPRRLASACDGANPAAVWPDFAAWLLRAEFGNRINDAGASALVSRVAAGHETNWANDIAGDALSRAYAELARVTEIANSTVGPVQEQADVAVDGLIAALITLGNHERVASDAVAVAANSHGMGGVYSGPVRAACYARAADKLEALLCGERAP